MVPTTDSVLYSFLLRTLAPLRPILFVGESGTAKSTIIHKYLSNLPSSGYSKLNINFSSRTTAAGNFNVALAFTSSFFLNTFYVHYYPTRCAK